MADRERRWRRGRLPVILAWAVMVATAAVTAEGQQYGRDKKYPDVSPRAAALQVVGVDTEITITYHRPGVKSRDVWRDNSLFQEVGKLVPFDGDPRPWRAGANETTSIELEHDVRIEGQPIAAGTYALFMIPTESEWTIIFNRRWQSWGSFDYDPAQDVLRVTVSPEEAPHQEWLTYGFDQLEPYSVRAFLHWSDKRVPFRIEVDRR